MWMILQIAAGGALGAVLRYGVVSGSARLLGAGFPLGTVLVNVLGSFLMGLATVALMARFGPVVMTGLLGGFTTFSAFSLDAVRLFEEGRLGAALVYVGGSVVLSLGALVIGMSVARGAAA